MTKKLFWDDPYLCTCTAKITSIEGNTVKLDQTCFFAFSGGQESDHGTIGGKKVLEAVKEGDKENIIDISYTLENVDGLTVGDSVEVVVDEERRTQLRKLHSLAHIVYYITMDVLGKVKIVGSHIAAEKARMDFGYEDPLGGAVAEIQEKTNAFIAADHPIKRFVDENNPDTWWWECNGWKMPCGGTHVRSTKEIGSVTLKRKNKGKGKERIEMFLA